MTGRSQTTPPAVVLGRSCIETVRPLALAGIRSHVVAPAREGSLCSRHARALTGWNWSASTRDREPELLDRLFRFARQQPEPLALMYCGEASLLFVSQNRSRLADVFRFVAPQAEAIEQLASKIRFAAHASRMQLGEWTRWAVRSEAKAYWSISDPMPLLITSIVRTVPREPP
jgi:predicted ATP-grasp superfamily ATP-dependent carboligase